MKFLSDADLRELGITFSRQHRQRLIDAGRFPKPVKLGAGGVNAWLDHEIEAYQKSCIAERDAKAAAAAGKPATTKKHAAAAEV